MIKCKSCTALRKDVEYWRRDSEAVVGLANRISANAQNTIDKCNRMERAIEKVVVAWNKLKVPCGYDFERALMELSESRQDKQ